GSKDGEPTNPEVQEYAQENSKKSTKTVKRGSDARQGFQQASNTPLPPAEKFDEDAQNEADGNVTGKLGKSEARGKDQS
uniref:hypothetical protein n=1 Tax=Pseudomonas canavaninivorans TaxID=2842348 RepID=UPI002B1E60F9